MNRPSEDSKTHNSQYGACNLKAQYYFDSLDTFCDEVKEGGGEATIGIVIRDKQVPTYTYI